MEKFAVFDGGRMISSAYADMSTALKNDDIATCEECIDKVLSFHLKKAWETTETLYLKKTKKRSLTEEGDLFFGGLQEIEGSLMPLFSEIGLISSPTTRNH